MGRVIRVLLGHGSDHKGFAWACSGDGLGRLLGWLVRAALPSQAGFAPPPSPPPCPHCYGDPGLVFMPTLMHVGPPHTPAPSCPTPQASSPQPPTTRRGRFSTLHARLRPLCVGRWSRRSECWVVDCLVGWLVESRQGCVFYGVADGLVDQLAAQSAVCLPPPPPPHLPSTCIGTSFCAWRTQMTSLMPQHATL